MDSSENVAINSNWIFRTRWCSFNVTVLHADENDLRNTGRIREARHFHRQEWNCLYPLALTPVSPTTAFASLSALDILNAEAWGLIMPWSIMTFRISSFCWTRKVTWVFRTSRYGSVLDPFSQPFCVSLSVSAFQKLWWRVIGIVSDAVSSDDRNTVASRMRWMMGLDIKVLWAILSESDDDLASS